ncbi:Uncharacterized protein OBRU01_16089 [Operophtera brumata]|uniref:FLYWCH-type domain-containing protein n=1 Tax=Operophtera brumata TaxID=104452 RepID=A0A0L7L3R3_OPEBR|nr:Uncharacterized protein OBRU01_16089 [Operophtera brumata]
MYSFKLVYSGLIPPSALKQSDTNSSSDSRSHVLIPTETFPEGGEQLLKIGAHWYQLDDCYRKKRRWTCARGCAARIHTDGKRLVFSELRHRCKNVNHTV